MKGEKRWSKQQKESKLEDREKPFFKVNKI